jgi:hypothetical protein
MEEIRSTSAEKEPWHFCHHCPDWPGEGTGVVIVFTGSRRAFKICEQCTALHKQGECHCS